MLCDICQRHRMVIGGSIFPHKEHHKRTWKSPDGTTQNQIDHIMITKKWRRSIMDVKVKRSADVNNDHMLVMAKVRLKLES